MATINGIGTTRYDWRGRPDGTAEATVWFVVFFFPIIPLRREHLRVIDSGIRRSGVLATLGALAGVGVGVGVGYQTSIQFLGTIPLSPIPVLRTYFMGFVVVPFLTVGFPVMLMIITAVTVERLDIEPNAVHNKLAPIVGIGGLLWVACVVARILDRSAGRFHVTPISHVAEKNIGIGVRVAPEPLPHHLASGSALGGSTLCSKLRPDR